MKKWFEALQYRIGYVPVSRLVVQEEEHAKAESLMRAQIRREFRRWNEADRALRNTTGALNGDLAEFATRPIPVVTRGA